MMLKTNGLSLAKITVAFAAGGSHFGSLETIAPLAASLDAEISGVFIEDTDLISAIRLPFALELNRITNRVKPVNSAEIERDLKHHAESARRLVTDTAERLGAKWSFDVVRKQTSMAVLDLVRITDVVVLSPGLAFRRFGKYQAPDSHKATNLIPSDRSVVLLLDSSSPSDTALQLAHKLADLHQLALSVIVIAATRYETDKSINQLCQKMDLQSVPIQMSHGASFSKILATVRVAYPAAVVAPSSMLRDLSGKLREFENLIDRPVFIVN